MSTDRTRPVAFFAAAAAVLLICAPAPSFADDRAIARTHFQRGSRLFAAGRFADARTEFEDAYRILPDARVLANAAACYAGERRPVEALRTYRRFMSGAGAQISPSMRRRTAEEIRRLKRAAGDVILAVEPLGAEIRVDGQFVGRAPLPWPVAVHPGARRIEVRAPGYGALSRPVRVERGQQVAVTIVLAPRSPEAIALASAEYGSDGAFRVRRGPAEPPPRDNRRTLLWTGVGLTAAFAVAAGITGTLTLVAANEYEDPGTPLGRRRVLYDDARQLSVATDILIGTAALAGLATLGLHLFGGPARPDERSAASSVRLNPKIAAGGLQCDVSWIF